MTKLLLSIGAPKWGMLAIIFIVFLVVCVLIGYAAVALFKFINKVSEKG